MATDFIVHDKADTVGVVVVEDVQPGKEVTGWIMETDETIHFKSLDAVPLGHKIALHDLKVGDTVLKYGHDVGRIVADVGQRPACTRSQSEDQKVVTVEKHSFFGYRRENGRVGIRNHVVILPLDDLSNASAEAVANNIKGTSGAPSCLRTSAVWRRPGTAFPHPDRHRQQPQCGGLCSDRHRTELDRPRRRRNRQNRQTGRGIFAIEGHGDINTIAAASRKAQEFVQWASEKQRESCSIKELFVSTKCGESDTTSGLASCPTVGNLIDKLDPLGATTCFGETSELTGAEIVCASRAATPEVKDRFMQGVQCLSRSDRPPQNQRPFRVATHQRKYRRRINHYRRKGVWQFAENRSQDEIHRRIEARGVASQGPRPVLHGYFFCCSGMRHAASGRRIRCASLPHRTG